MLFLCFASEWKMLQREEGREEVREEAPSSLLSLSHSLAAIELLLLRRGGVLLIQHTTNTTAVTRDLLLACLEGQIRAQNFYFLSISYLSFLTMR